MEKTAVEIVLLLTAAGLIPAFIARSKGRGFLKWWIYGSLLPVVALPHALMLHLGEGSKKCPYCHRTSPMGAMYCRSCGFEFM